MAELSRMVGIKSVIYWLWELLQTVWKTGQVPSEWKRSTLVPLHKKNDRKVCNNYCRSSLLNVPGKVLALIPLEWLLAIIEPQLMDTQYGFRKRRSQSNLGDPSGGGDNERVPNPSESLFCRPLQAYNSLNRTALVAILRSYRVPHQLVDIIQELYMGTECHVRTADGVSED